MAVLPTSVERKLLFDPSEQGKLKLATFDHNKRIAFIDGWLQTKIESAEKSAGDVSIDVEDTITVLVEHAQIFWRMNGQRAHSVSYLRRALEIFQQPHGLNAQSEQRSLLMLCAGMVRMGEYEPAYSSFEKLDNALRLRFAVAALFAEKNQPWSYKRDALYSYCWEQYTPLSTAIINARSSSSAPAPKQADAPAPASR
jgi:hypothetical protein